MIYCTKCGKPSEETSNFCIYCGARLFKPARAVQQQQEKNTEISIKVAPGYVSEYQNKAINATSSPADSWEISVSFGKSTSSNFDRALYLAQHANRYEVTTFNGKDIYQAFFSSEPQSFLSFVKLYEMVGSWKSATVTINGEFVDRKIVGGLKYCYGDRCRSGRSDFCYGASYMTRNPFGCHRLQISSCNNPWWGFTYYNGRDYTVDKKALLEHAATYSTAYRMCPCFDWNRVVQAINRLPNTIPDPSTYIEDLQ